MPSRAPESTPSRLGCLHVVNLLAYIVNVFVTYLVGVGGYMDLPSNSELSQKYQTLVTPVGWAFSIWSLIFGFQAVWSIAPLCAAKLRDNPLLHAVGYDYVGVCLAQASWTISFALEAITTSLIAMLAIFALLWRIVLRLSNTSSSSQGLASYVLWQLPFTLHAGWITAATFLNANVLLVSLEMSTQVQFTAALVTLAGLLVIAVLTGLYVDLIIPLVIAWALFGIYSCLRFPLQSIQDTFDDSQIELASWGSLLFAGLIALGSLVGLVRQCFRKRPQATTEESRYLRAD